ncbi:MAG: hypothetical protein NT159_06830 [Proteobacteria bacterium]|nr:hypothetical protein [Pseudomonadota bacterium]
MKIYQLHHACDERGGPLFRTAAPTHDDRRKLVIWSLAHQRGRETAKTAFGTVHFEWDGFDQRPVADFPVTEEPLAIWSVQATSVLGEFLKNNGDLHPILLDGQPNRYELFDCWRRIDATPNAGFSAFVGGSLKSISITPDVILPDIFLISISIGPMVSERFKMAVEKAGLTGMTFSEVDVLRS